ncbi:MAG: hypothetical protein ACOVP1_05585 [Bacteroidia bacterium]
MLAVGCWLLAVGCWLLAPGFWLLANCTRRLISPRNSCSFSPLAPYSCSCYSFSLLSYWLLASGYWLLATGC